MKQLHIIFMLVWWTQGFVGSSNGNLDESNGGSNQIQERAARSPPNFKKAFKMEAIKEGLPEALGSVGVIMQLAEIDYNGSPGEVMKDVADAVVPLIAVGLSMIPGGNVIGGLVVSVYGMLSSFMGTKGKSPMEKMVDGIKDEINGLKKLIAHLGKELPEMIRKERNENYKSIINRAINSELGRNNYICSKYALISADYINDMKKNKSIRESLRSEMVYHIHNCDNFLKDTAEAFVFPEFADVLWVASTVTTLVRLTFLTEICNYGYALQIDKAILRAFWAEMKHDMKRHFEFVGNGVNMRLESLAKNFNPSFNYKHLTVNLTDSEYQGCRIQAQLLYLDREMYPYGVPKPFHIFNNNEEITMADYNITTNEGRHHIQVYYNDVHLTDTDRTEALLNCLMGPGMITRVTKDAISFRVVYVTNKSYQVRMLYFRQTEEMISTNVFTSYLDWDENTIDRVVTVSKEGTNSLNIIIDLGKPNNNSYQRFELKTGYHKMLRTPPLIPETEIEPSENTFYPWQGMLGVYVIENIYAFNVLSENETKGKITITNNAPIYTLVLGVEFIVLPIIE